MTAEYQHIEISRKCTSVLTLVMGQPNHESAVNMRGFF